MRTFRGQILTILHLFILFGILTVVQANTLTSLDGSTQLTYWYTGDSFDVNQEDTWIPFFSAVDVPYSLPMRGFISDSRNYFFDFGAVDWLSDWIEYRYGWDVPDYEKNLDEDDIAGQLEYFFETMTARLQKPHSYVDEERNFTALDYVKDFEPPYEAFIPLVVMYGLDEMYDDSNMDEWVIHPDIIENTLNDAFPLVTWETELYWFDYNNATAFADLMEEKTSSGSIWMDYDFISKADEIIHDIIVTDPRYVDCDLVLPTLILLQDYTLVAATYDPPFAVGGLGRLPSAYPEIDSWCLNGRSAYSYFYAGNPDNPRTAITSTVIHELGHCIGQTDLHSLFGWFATSSSMSVMGAYQQPTSFDRFDKDLINNAQGLQLWGRYLDEINYFRSFPLNTIQQSQLDSLETSLSSISNLLITSDFVTLRVILYDVDTQLNQISIELGESRKSTGWSDNAPILDMQIDWIVGPGIPNAENIAEVIEAELNANREVTMFFDTTLPTARYNVTINVHSSVDAYNDALLQFWGLNMFESNTSSFVEEEVPDDAFTSWPRNKVFQNQTGFAINGYTVEEWLTDNPFTSNVANKIQYRFYMLNLENVTPINRNDTGLILLVIVVGGGASAIVIAVAVIRRKK